MRAAVNVFALWSAALMLCPAPARAEGSGQAGADRFVPSLAITSGVLVQNWHGELDSQICRGCMFGDPMASPEPLRGIAKGSDLDVSPFVGGTLEIMTPELALPGSPRLFAGAEFLGAFGFERKVAREGDPNRIGSPTPDSPQQPFDEDQALGQGSELIAQIDTTAWGAHAGIAFPTSLLGRALRIRASVAWLQYRVDLDGRVLDAECLDTLLANNCNPQVPSGVGFLREIDVRGSTDETFDGLGPGLDVEMDAGRFGPLGVSLFLGGRAYKILSGRTVTFESPVLSIQDQLSAPDTDEHIARFRYEVDEWLYRGVVGIRFHWLGSAN